MSDKTMEDIKSGKGLPPLSSNSDSNGQTGVGNWKCGFSINIDRSIKASSSSVLKNCLLCFIKIPD